MGPRNVDKPKKAKQAKSDLGKGAYQHGVQNLLGQISGSSVELSADDVPSSSYQATPGQKKDYEKLDEKGFRRTLMHRDGLMVTVILLAVASFCLLAFAVLFTMIQRKYNPYYVGVSDTVINVLSVSVFGQVLALMASISYHLWKDKKSNQPAIERGR